MFQVLKYNERFMAWVGVRAYRFTEQTNEFFTSIVPWYILLMVFMFTISSIVYFYMSLPTFESQTCIVFLCGFQILGMLISFGSKMNTVKAVHLRLQQIVDAEDPKSEEFQMYRNVEEMCRKFTKMIAMYVPMNQIMTFASLFYSFYSIWIGDVDTSKWILPFKFALPFDTKILWKWYILWFVNLNIGLMYATSVTLIPSYFVAFCLYICAICDHFKLLIKSIQKDLESDLMRQKSKQFEGKFQQTKEKLCKAIRIQIKAFEIFDLVAEINSGIIFSLLPINVLFMALTMYGIEFFSFDVVSFFFCLVTISCSFTWPLVFCYFSNSTTDRVAYMGEDVYDSEWFNYPPKYQKYVILIIRRSQDPVNFSGFNLVQCTLESFGQILKSSVSYYMLFRGLSQR